MKRIQSIVAMLLAVLLCMGSFAMAEGAAAGYQLGGKIGDFTVTTFDGKTVTLSEVLKEKEMVLINIWATWCGPCRNEFPFMEEAYKQYSDKVEIIALSCEPTDTDDVLAEFVAAMGMTFNVARDTAGMANKFNVSSIPTSVVVDRFGTICFWESGSLPDAGSFTRLFDAFLGDAYTESVILNGIPAAKPNVAPSTEAELTAALESAAANLADESVWPMVVTEKDGRSVVASSNTTYGNSTAAVRTTHTAKAGDAIVVTFKTSTEAACDLLNIDVNGTVVKVFGGEHDWMTYAIPVEADGEYTLTLSYVKDVMENAAEDTVWVDSVAVVSGDAAAAALAANPAYPVADAAALNVTSPNAREIVISDDNGLLAASFGDARYVIINGDEASFEAALPAGTDPEGAFFYCYYDGQTIGLPQVMTETGYAITTGVDAQETTGYTYAYVALYLDPAGENALLTVYFRNEANVNAFVTNNALGTWKYTDGAAPASDEQPADVVEIIAEAAYTVKYVDQNGNPVAGVMCQVCDAATCQVFVSDANGLCEFVLTPYAWEIHTLKVPEGYEGDTETVTIAPVEGGEMVFTLKKL